MRIEHKKLDSGLNIYLCKNESPVSMFQLCTPFGGNLLRYKDAKTDKIMNVQPGSAHYFEHVLFIMPPLGKDGKEINYRTNIPKTKKNLRDGLAVLQDNQATIVNAYTWDDITNYWFISRKNQLENLGIMMGYVFAPYLPQDRFKKEVGTILDEAARGENNPYRKQEQVLMKQLFKKHGAQNPVIGTRESIKRISLEDVLSMHDTFYSPSNMSLIVTGNLKMDLIVDMANNKLNELGKQDYVAPPLEIDQGETNGVVIKDNFDNPLLRPDVANQYIVGNWKCLISPLSETTEEIIDLNLVMKLATCSLFGKGSKNREKLVKQGMDERTFRGESDGFRDQGQICFGGIANEPKTFKELIMNVSNEVTEKGISSEELDYSRNSLLRVSDIEDGSIIDFGGNLTRYGMLTKNPGDYFKYLERVENISVDKINSLLPRILNPENLSFVLMTPQK